MNSNHALYQLLESYPWASVTSVLVMVLVGIFFVSGADAASLAMASMIAATVPVRRPRRSPWHGTGRWYRARTACPSPGKRRLRRRRRKYPGEALTGLQNLTIVVSLPFVIVMVLLCLALYRDLRKDPMMLRHLRGTELIEKAVLYGAVKHGEEFYIVVQEKKSSTKRTHTEAQATEL